MFFFKAVNLFYNYCCSLQCWGSPGIKLKKENNYSEFAHNNTRASTCSLFMISDLVMVTRSASSTAKAGKEMTERRPASISFEGEALGSMEQRMDWRKAHTLSVRKFNGDHWAAVGGGKANATWQCSTSSGNTWMTDFGPPWAPKRSNSSIASSAAWKTTAWSTKVVHVLTQVEPRANLRHSYGAAVELRDALVSLVTSLPHPIILKEDKTDEWCSALSTNIYLTFGFSDQDEPDSNPQFRCLS